jgi:hypothetical protein
MFGIYEVVAVLALCYVLLFAVAIAGRAVVWVLLGCAGLSAALLLAGVL